MKVIKYTFTFSFFVLLSCQVKQKKINYGTDHCEFCQMTIVDKQHAAQVVTKKGKAYSFDAIECMVHYSEKMDPSTIGLFLSANFNPPSSLLDATQSFFVISENIPSPMGAFLSSVPTKEEADSIVGEKGGTIYNWSQLVKHLNSNE